jgi:hypothetical protein
MKDREAFTSTRLGASAVYRVKRSPGNKVGNSNNTYSPGRSEEAGPVFSFGQFFSFESHNGEVGGRVPTEINDFVLDL